MSEFRRRLMMAAQGGAAHVLPYLCFTALEEGTFTLTIGSDVTTSILSYIEYSVNNGNSWVRTNNIASTEVVITTPTIEEGGKVYWRGSGTNCASSYGNNSKASVFSSTGQFDASGVLMTLLNPSAESNSTMSKNMSFVRLFVNNTKIKDASEIIMPPNVKDRCYQEMFLGCTNLTKAPSLPSTTTALGCYATMFNGCNSLTDAPILPAQTLSMVSYNTMFYNCKALRYLVMLATDISASQCLVNWVHGLNNTSDFVFVKHIDATWTNTGSGGTLSNWKIIYYNPSTDKYYLSDKTTECDDHGNVINA